ncbi:MAG: flagellar basal body-associated FliL family protein [Rickettsiales bacterium]|jgi:flagellar FliL protein
MADNKAKDEKTPDDEDVDAGTEGGENPEGGAASSKKSKKKKIIIIAILLLLIGGGVGGYMMFSGKTEHIEKEAVDVDEHGNPINKAVYYTMPQFLVNLNTSTKSQVFLKATVVLEVAKETDIPFIESNLPRLVDGINTYLRELRSSDLAGSAGIQRLREEILLRVNKSIEPVQINEVLFKEIIVQ